MPPVKMGPLVKIGAEGANRRAGPVHGAELTVGPWQAGAAGRGAWRPNRPVCIVGPGPGCRSVGAGDTRGRTVPSGEPGWPFVFRRGERRDQERQRACRPDCGCAPDDHRPK